MRLRLAFYQEAGVDDDMPTLVAACDEYTEDVWGGIPDFYTEDKAKVPAEHVREVLVHIPDAIIHRLFTPDEVTVHQVTEVSE